MTIAVHISAGKHESLSDNFNFVCFSALAQSHPESHFIFIFDIPPHPEVYLEPNCTPVILPPALKNSLLRHYWYNYKLPAVVQKYNADVCITDRLSCSLRMSIPQCLVVDTNQLRAAGRSVYLQRFLPVFIRKAAHIFSLDLNAAELMQNKSASPSKISLLYPGLKVEAAPLMHEEREAVKDKFAAGNEYFLHLTTNSDFEKVKVVLKAFSVFKKWQKSSMRMLLIVPPGFQEVLSKEIATYKYREDVLILSIKESTENLISSAYALLLEKENLLTASIPAMKSGVPVIIHENQFIKKALPSVVETAWHETSISEKMMKIYKDESFRAEIIERGFRDSAKYSWEGAGKHIWDVLSDLTHHQTD